MSQTVRSPRRTEHAPTDLTRLIGREREVDEIHRLLASSRLLTLTGSGGTGKTRLAMEAVRRVALRPGERLAWVELAPVEDPTRLPQILLEAVEIREELPAGGLEGLASLLGPDPLLLVLDNCEHLVEACAELADGLLRSSPALRILATSREALGVKGERALLVPPLSLPLSHASIQEMEGAEAIQLFVDRARDAVAGFSLTAANAAAVREICARLDGLPLAIELAAARVRVLSPEQIRDRLDDAFRLLTTGGRATIPRHRTLRAAIEWSYDLLPEQSRALLHRLSVFRGGFTLDAAEVVGADPPDRAAGKGGPASLDEEAILDGIARLVDRSLIQVQEVDGFARYSLLETIRQYAAQRLEESGEAEEVRRRHAHHMAAFAEKVEPHVFGGQGEPGWMARLDREAGNLRAAADWADADPARRPLAARLASALQWYWFARGALAEGRRRVEDALADPELLPGPVRARAQVALGNLAFWQGDHGAIRGPMEAAVAELRTAADPSRLAAALTGLGMAAHLEGDTESAKVALDEAWNLVRELPRGTLTVFVLYWRGLAAQGRGEAALARTCFQEGVEVGEALGDGAASSHSLTVLGRLYLAEGDLSAAGRALTRGLEGHRAVGDRWGMATALQHIARLSLAEGEAHHAVRMLAAADAIRHAIDSALPDGERPEHERMLAELRAALHPDGFDAAWREGAGLGLDEVVAGARAALSDPDARDARDAREGTGAPGPAPPTPLPSPSPTSSASKPGDPPALGVRALGTFQVEVGGRPLEPSTWSHARPRELLLFLLLHPRGVTREEIGSALWPDATPPQVKNSFHVALHHLRKQLGGPDWIVLEGDRYRLTPDRTVEWDGALFEAGVRAALKRTRAGHGDQDELRSLLGLYGGELLPGSGSSRWLEDARDHFRRLHVDGRMALARLLEIAGDSQGAAEEYLAVIREEELNEEAHRGLMSTWATAGQRDRAIRHFERLALLLRETLETVPEEETRALHRSILAGGRGGPDSLPPG